MIRTTLPGPERTVAGGLILPAAVAAPPREAGR